jgi:hypothetical protein
MVAAADDAGRTGRTGAVCRDGGGVMSAEKPRGETS